MAELLVPVDFPRLSSWLLLVLPKPFLSPPPSTVLQLTEVAGGINTLLYSPKARSGPKGITGPVILSCRDGSDHLPNYSILLGETK